MKELTVKKDSMICFARHAHPTGLLILFHDSLHAVNCFLPVCKMLNAPPHCVIREGQKNQPELSWVAEEESAHTSGKATA